MAFIKAEHGRGIARPPIHRDPGFNRKMPQNFIDRVRKAAPPRRIDPGFNRGAYPRPLPNVAQLFKQRFPGVEHPMIDGGFNIDRGAHPGGFNMGGDYVPQDQFPQAPGAGDEYGPDGPGNGMPNFPMRPQHPAQGLPGRPPMPQHPFDFGGMPQMPQHPLGGLGADNPSIQALIQELVQQRKRPDGNLDMEALSRIFGGPSMPPGYGTRYF